MKLLHRLSLYLAIVPVILSILAYLLHDAMNCGLQCTGIISYPIDFVARLIMFYVGFNLAWFFGLASLTLIGEICYALWNKTRN